MKTYKTQKGTELKLMNLKGKDYLPVQERLIWFREERPLWSIETQGVNVTDSSAVFRAEVKDEAGRVVSTGHKSETKSGFADFMEKAETGSVGRALAMLGYGTQFCADELDEGERIVDSPRDNVKPLPKPLAAAVPADLGDFKITVGKKYAGKTLKEIGNHDLDSYRAFMAKSAAQAKLDGKPEDRDWMRNLEAISDYLDQHERPAAKG